MRVAEELLVVASLLQGEVLEGLEVSLEPDDGSAPIARWPVPVAYRALGLPISPARRARLAPGRGYRIRVRIFGGNQREQARGAFRILSDAERAAAEREWSALPDRENGFLRAEWLLTRGRADEALEIARDLAVRHPGRGEPARLALVALERLGLRGEAPWREEAKRLEEAR